MSNRSNFNKLYKVAIFESYENNKMKIYFKKCVLKHLYNTCELYNKNNRI